MPSKDFSDNYYEQYCQLSIANLVMQHQIKKLLAERQDICLKLRSQKREEEIKANNNRPNEDESISSSGAMSGQLSVQAQAALNQKQVYG